MPHDAHTPVSQPSTRLVAGGVLLLAAVCLLICLTTTLARPAKQNQHAGTTPITYRIDLNKADRDTLCLLPGIAEGKANHIVADRQVNGPFKDSSDLTRVYLIGPKTAAAIQPWARFEPEE